ncbi:MAG: hypothetical protein ACLPVF_03555 [Acidimicrobiales bacterium]
MSFLAQSFLVALMVCGVLLAAAALAFVVVRRALRRRWHGVRDHVATRGVLAGVSLMAAWRERVGARATPETSSAGTAARARRRMWLAVEDAEAAVRHADAVQAPVADLPAVCRSLRQVAAQLDPLLRLERRLPLGSARPAAVQAQVADVIGAAHDVQSAALRACGDANEPQIRELVRQAGNEVEIVAAALARMRSISPS